MSLPSKDVDSCTMTTTLLYTLHIMISSLNIATFNSISSYSYNIEELVTLPHTSRSLTILVCHQHILIKVYQIYYVIMFVCFFKSFLYSHKTID